MSLKCCTVDQCQKAEQNLYRSHQDVDQQSKLKSALGTQENEFYVCGLHFGSEIKPNAISAIVVDGGTEEEEDGCECCSMPFKSKRLKVELDQKLNDSILELLSCKLTLICFDCSDIIIKFAKIKNHVIDKQKVLRQTEVKEELLAEIAENRPTRALDPFECEVSIKEELSSDSEETMNKPHIRIIEDQFQHTLEQHISDQQIKYESKSRNLSLKSSCGFQPLPGGIKMQLRTKYTCDICQKTYRSKNSLLKHILQHFAVERCFSCSKIFHDKKELMTHKNRCHSKSTNFVCEKCEKVHQTNKKMVKCCDGKLQTCPVCHKAMKSSSICSHIKLVHNKDRDQICQICGKTLKTNYDLKVHLRNHSGERPEICETCGKTFISYAQLYKHRKVRHMTRESFQCSICLKNLLSRFKLKCHMERFHPNGFDNGLRVDVQSNCYHCKICPLKFVAMHKYEKHLKLNDCQKYAGFATSEDVQLAKDAKGEFKCQDCGSVLNTIKGLKKHMRFVHPKEPQSCKICFKQLKNPHTLWQHMTLSHKQPIKKRKT